ncbi:hypothetical protein HGRIS_002413 [Hohenbuehelia grisea]|uniref:F-box domain-containing protein n=1 Tax=Hohenbuehelia grisea TaxID=104357 RepID=A0ABR3JKW8_9AGAR
MSQSPIGRVPPELLRTIFIECLPKDIKYLKPSFREAPLVLCQVCVLWRSLAVDMSFLWSSLKVTVSEQASTDIRMIDLWLKRAAAAPLSISCSLDLFPPVKSTLVSHASKALQALAARMAFWQDVHFVIPGTHSLLRHLPVVPAAYLHNLTIDLRNWQADEVGDLNGILHSAPSLRRLQWGNRCSWSGWDVGFEDILCSLRVEWTHLTHVVFDAWINLEDTLHILRQCHDLVECDLRHFGGRSPPNEDIDVSTPPIKLPHLRTLKLYQLHLDEGLGYLLDTLVCPSLEEFSGVCGFLGQVAWPQSQFLDFLDRSSCELAKLTLECVGIREDQLIDCLKAINASLRRLHAIDAREMLTVTQDLLSALTWRNTEQPLLCPQLQALHFEVPVRAPDGMLADMVESRRRGLLAGKCGPLERIGFVRAEERHERDIERLKELSRHGLALGIF